MKIGISSTGCSPHVDFDTDLKFGTQPLSQKKNISKSAFFSVFDPGPHQPQKLQRHVDFTHISSIALLDISDDMKLFSTSLSADSEEGQATLRFIKKSF